MQTDTPTGTVTYPSNGSLPSTSTVLVEDNKVSIGEAMRRAVEELGDRTIDSQLAAGQMVELADCYEEVVRRQAAFNAKNDEAKTAKKSLESAEALVLEKIRTFTHAAALPLFDHIERENDQAAMEGAATADAPLWNEEREAAPASDAEPVNRPLHSHQGKRKSGSKPAAKAKGTKKRARAGA